LLNLPFSSSISSEQPEVDLAFAEEILQTWTVESEIKNTETLSNRSVSIFLTML
jgi:hypothetical protein